MIIHNNKQLIIIIAATAAAAYEDDTVGHPHRAQLSQLEFVELMLSLTFDEAILYRAIRADGISVNSAGPLPSCVRPDQLAGQRRRL